MVENHTTQVAEVNSLGPFEDAEILLFEAPFDGLIANVTFKPSEDLQGGAYSARGSLQLIMHPRDVDRKVVSDIQLNTAEVLLPGGERHNARLFFPPVSLRVREGEPLLWSSIGSVGEGLTVPEGSVEVVFERKQIAEDLSPPELWVECIPNYWIGKRVLVESTSVETPLPEHGPGASSAYVWKHMGTFDGADRQVVKVGVDPSEHGRLPRKTGFHGSSSNG